MSCAEFVNAEIENRDDVFDASTSRDVGLLRRGCVDADVAALVGMKDGVLVAAVVTCRADVVAEMSPRRVPEYGSRTSKGLQQLTYLSTNHTRECRLENT